MLGFRDLIAFRLILGFRTMLRCRVVLSLMIPVGFNGYIKVSGTGAWGRSRASRGGRAPESHCQPVHGCQLPNYGEIL